jgi:predicted nucleic acid-binding protein
MTAKIIRDGLDDGESSSIALAMETKNSLLIIDEDRARKYALNKGLPITGTLSIIGNAYDRGFIDSYKDVCDDLQKVNFRFSQKIQNEVMEKIAREKSSRKKSGGRSR